MAQAGARIATLAALGSVAVLGIVSVRELAAGTGHAALGEASPCGAACGTGTVGWRGSSQDAGDNLEAAWEYAGWSRAVSDREGARVAALAHERLERGDDLFDVMTGLVAAMMPGHGAYVRTTDGRFWCEAGLGDPLTTDRVLSVALPEHVPGVESLAEGRVIAGRLSDGTRYIALRCGEASEGAPQPGSDEVIGAVDRLLGELDPGAPVVFDLRSAYTAEPLVIASRLVDERRTAFRLRGFGGGGSAAAEPRQLAPSAGVRASGPVVLLTDGTTRRGAEIVAIATMSSPRVTRVGSPTAGLPRPIKEVPLPNGWRLGLPIGEFLPVDESVPDRSGITPHIQAADEAPGSADAWDGAIESALAYLDRLRASGLIPREAR